MCYQNHARTLGFVVALLLCIGSVGGSVALLEIAASGDAPAAARLA